MVPTETNQFFLEIDEAKIGLVGWKNDLSILHKLEKMLNCKVREKNYFWPNLIMLSGASIFTNSLTLHHRLFLFSSSRKEQHSNKVALLTLLEQKDFRCIIFAFDLPWVIFIDESWFFSTFISPALLKVTSVNQYWSKVCGVIFEITR